MMYDGKTLQSFTQRAIKNYSLEFPILSLEQYPLWQLYQMA